MPVMMRRPSSAKHRAPTSRIFDDLLHDAPEGGVSLGWAIGHLRERSFGVVMLLVALVGMVPGTSVVVGILLAVQAVQMMIGRSEPWLPGPLARRRFATPRLTRVIGRILPVLRWLERFVRPRWITPLGPTRGVVGALVFLLGISLLTPIPFSQVIPALVIMLLAFALLEEDGVLLAIALLAALGSLAITAGAVWGTVEAGLAL